MTPARAALLRSVADLLPRTHEPVLVVVDSVDGSSKTTFADELALVLMVCGSHVARANIDAFCHPRAHGHAEGRTAEAVWSRHLDYAALRRELLEPWRAGPPASYRSAWHDVVTDERVDVAPVPVPRPRRPTRRRGVRPARGAPRTSGPAVPGLTQASRTVPRGISRKATR